MSARQTWNPYTMFTGKMARYRKQNLFRQIRCCSEAEHASAGGNPLARIALSFGSRDGLPPVWPGFDSRS